MQDLDFSQFAQHLDIRLSVKELIDRFEPSRRISEHNDLALLSGTSLISYLGGKDGKVYKFQSLPLFLVQYNVLSMLDMLRRQHWEEALCLLHEMLHRSLMPSVVSYSAAISACDKGQHLITHGQRG